MEREVDYFGMRENTYLMLMHFSQFFGFIIVGLGFIAPIVLWLIRKDQSPVVDKHGKNILNFLLSWIIYYAVAGILILLMIGGLMLIALFLMQVVFVILAGIKANDGIYWKYPLSFEFFK